jgi:hypothetical protein
MVDARGFLHPALGFAALSEPTAQHPALASEAASWPASASWPTDLQ